MTDRTYRDRIESLEANVASHERTIATLRKSLSTLLDKLGIEADEPSSAERERLRATIEEAQKFGRRLEREGRDL